MEIISLDLETGISDVILTTESPQCYWGNADLEPKICGGIAAVRMYDTIYRQLYLVINWRAQSYCTIIRTPVSKPFLNVPCYRSCRSFVARGPHSNWILSRGISFLPKLRRPALFKKLVSVVSLRFLSTGRHCR